MNKRILLFICHPKKKSLVQALAHAFIKGAEKTGAEVKVHDLYGENFQPLLHDIEENERDPVVRAFQSDILWADGLVFISPLWWANVPAMLKGFFDRVFTENFAFIYNQAGLPVGQLKNRKALLIGTCDTPSAIARITKTSLGFKAVVKGVLKLSGIKEARFKLFGSVLASSIKQREQWLTQADELGYKFTRPDTSLKKLKKETAAVLTAVRLPLYSFVFASILLGIAVGSAAEGRFDWSGFWLAAITGLLCHAAVSLANESADEETDRMNRNRTPFSGGTGLLAEGRISKTTLNAGWITAAGLSLFLASFLVFISGASPIVLIGLTAGLILGLGYSLPPFRLSRIGLGEIAAFFGYGIPMMFIGLGLQANAQTVKVVLSDFRLYILSLPLSAAVFVTLCLTQIPDTDADRKAGKASVAVILGPKRVMSLSAALYIFAALSCLLLAVTGTITWTAAGLTVFIPTAALAMLLKYREAYKIPAGMTMINLMGLAATTTVLCGIIPALSFLISGARVFLRN